MSSNNSAPNGAPVQNIDTAIEQLPPTELADMPKTEELRAIKRRLASAEDADEALSAAWEWCAHGRGRLDVKCVALTAITLDEAGFNSIKETTRDIAALDHYRKIHMDMLDEWGGSMKNEIIVRAEECQSDLDFDWDNAVSTAITSLINSAIHSYADKSKDLADFQSLTSDFTIPLGIQIADELPAALAKRII